MFKTIKLKKTVHYKKENVELNKELNDFDSWVNGYSKITINNNYNSPWYIMIYNKIFNYINSYINTRNDINNYINTNNDKWFGKLNF